MYDDTYHETTHRKKHFFSRLSSSPKQRDTRKRRSEENNNNEPLRLLTAMPIIVQSPTPTDEDAAPTTPPRSISRRKSHLELWIGDQHAHAVDQDGIAQGSSPNPYPYLAYCDTRHARSASRDDDSGSIPDSFVLVDGDDGIGGSCREELNVFEEAPPFSLGTPQGTRSYSSLLRTPPSLRAFRFSLSPSHRTSPSPYDSSPSLYHDSSPRFSLSMGRHGRTFSDGSPTPPQLQSTPQKTPSTTSSPRSYGSWAFKRPGVLGAFTPPGSDVSVDEGSALHLSPPRPSFSSSLTFSSGTTGASTNISTPNIASPTYPTHSHRKGPQHSLWSLPSDASHLQDPPNAENSVLIKPGSLRLPFSFKSPGKGFRHVPTVLPISREKRKKKLIVSGIAKGDQARLEAVRKWCESFGEVNQITRMPNGDLHIDFRKAEVADTVCRVNARVHIAGVGSVSLSWYSGKRP